MRKDIEIPVVEGVYIAAVREWDEAFLSQNWFVYLINDTTTYLQLTMIVSRGSDEGRKTAQLRHAFGSIPPKSSQKIEMLIDEVLGFNNEFLLTYFKDDKLYEKTFVFEPYKISEGNLQQVPIIKEGVLAT